MSKIAVLINDGVEEMECFTTVDLCRHGGIDATTISVTGNEVINGAHDTRFFTDTLMSEVDFDAFDGIVFPGGPGTDALGKVPGVRELAKQFLDDGRLLAAICAVPGMLSETGLFKDRTATGYPGLTPEGGANWTKEQIERDGNLITGKGPGASAYFAIEIVRYLQGDEAAEQIYDYIQLS